MYFIICISARRKWDSNPRAACTTYRFSRPDPSTTWVFLHKLYIHYTIKALKCQVILITYFINFSKKGGESNPLIEVLQSLLKLRSQLRKPLTVGKPFYLFATDISQLQSHINIFNLICQLNLLFLK